MQFHLVCCILVLSIWIPPMSDVMAANPQHYNIGGFSYGTLCNATASPIPPSQMGVCELFNHLLDNFIFFSYCQIFFTGTRRALFIDLISFDTFPFYFYFSPVFSRVSRIFGILKCCYYNDYRGRVPMRRNTSPIN